MKKNTRIQMPGTRAEKVHQDQKTNSFFYNEGALVYIEKQDVLLFQFETDGRMVFKVCKEGTPPTVAYASDGLLIYIEKNLFNIENYTQL